MPTYEYECQACHERVEAVQKFSDAALTTCPKCGGDLRKVFSAVGIVFKGSGFYKNDSRSTAKSPAPATSTTTPAPAASTDSSSTPAATPSTTTTSTSTSSTSSD
jgi:putative FmdB family regulatory protein